MTGELAFFHSWHAVPLTGLEAHKEPHCFQQSNRAQPCLMAAAQGSDEINATPSSLPTMPHQHWSALHVWDCIDCLNPKCQHITQYSKRGSRPKEAEFWQQGWELRPPYMPDFFTWPLRSSKNFAHSIAAVVWGVKFHRNEDAVVRDVPFGIVQALNGQPPVSVNLFVLQGDPRVEATTSLPRKQVQQHFLCNAKVLPPQPGPLPRTPQALS